MVDIAETREFLEQNASFFRTPLTDQSRFIQFYEATGKLGLLQDYSQQLTDLLRDHYQEPHEHVRKSVIYAWRNGDFEPALQHPAICDFLIANKDHLAILLWNDNVQQERLKTADPQNVEDKIQQVETTLITAGFECPTLHLGFKESFQKLREDYLSGTVDDDTLAAKSTEIKLQIDSFMANFSSKLSQLTESGVDEAIAVINKERSQRPLKNMSTPKLLFNLLSNLKNLRLSFLSGDTSVESLVGVKLSAEGEALRIWKGVEKRTQLMASSGFDLALEELRKKRPSLFKRKHPDEANEILRLCSLLQNKKEAYINSELPFHEFKKICEQVIGTAMQGELGKHRGIKGVLQVILNCLSQFFTGSPYTLNTDSKNKLQQTRDALQKACQDSDSDESLGARSQTPMD